MKLVTTLIKVVSACLALTVGLTARATLFHGEITTTITSTTNPYYSAGQTFTGFYEFEASSDTGTFFTPYYAFTTENQSLTGCVGLPVGPSDSSEQLAFMGPHHGAYVIYLSVHDGVVGGFHWSIESVVYPAGEFPYLRLFAGVNFDGFNLEQTCSYNDANGIHQDIDYLTSGTLTFGTANMVDDTTKTSWLLGLSLLGGLLLVRQLPAKTIRNH